MLEAWMSGWQTTRVGSLLGAAIVLAACFDAERQPGTPTAAASGVAVGPVATPAPGACEDAATRCRDVDVAERCHAGQWVEAPCADGSICAGSRCTPLASYGAPALTRADVRGTSGRGYWNAWSAHVGVSTKTASEVAASGSLEALGDPARARALCDAEGTLRPTRSGSGAAVATAWILSDAPRELALRATVTGALDLRVGDVVHRLVELPGDGAAMPDEREVPISLPAGRVPIVASLEPATGAFALRVVERDGRPARGIVLVERSTRCAPETLLDVEPTLALRADGLHVVGAPTYPGLVPHGPSPALRVSVKHGRRALPQRSVALAPAQPFDEAIPVAPEGVTSVELAVGERAPRHVRLPPGPLVARIRALLGVHERVAADTRLASGVRASFAHHVGVLADAAARGETDLGWLARHVERAEELVPALERGEDPYAGRRGLAFRAHRSPLDDRLSPYVVFVPRTIEAGTPLPVVMVAHGRDRLPEHALRTVIGQAPDEHMSLSFAAKHFPAFPEQGAILVAPSAHGNAGVQGVAEHDALAVLDELARSYPVDPERISITGYSMGGTLSFVLPLHHPDRFAATAPLCGYPNLLGYKSVSGEPKQPWEEPLLAKEYVVSYAENGLHLPMHVVHGGKDVPGRSKVVVDRYREFGYRAIFDVPEDADHDVWTDAYEDGRMIPWLTRQRLPRAPKRVRFVTGEYRYDRAHWVRVVALEDAASPARAEVDATWRPEASTIDLSVARVDVLELDLTRLDPAPKEAVTLRIGDQALTAPPGAPAFVVRDGASFRVATTPPELPDRKHHGQSGPLDDAQFHPITIVVGTQQPELREAHDLLAEHLATLGGSAAIRYPVLTDAEATDARLAGRSVVLIGGPASNLLTRAVAPLLPVRFEAGAISVRGRRHEGPDVGVSFIAPGPVAFGAEAPTRDPSRYVVVHAGLSSRAVLATRSLPRYLPDWVVYDAGLATSRGGLLFGTRPVRAAGFFSERWE